MRAWHAWLLVSGDRGRTGDNPEAAVRDGRSAGAARWQLGRVRPRPPVGAGALTGVMIAAFALKMVFFGVYVVVMLRVLDAAAGAVRGEFCGVSSSRCTRWRRCFSGAC